MKPKTKAFFLNFVCFGLIFVTIRFGINYFFPRLPFLYASLISGVTTVFLSPRFASIPTKQGKKVFMKWIFFKDLREF